MTAEERKREEKRYKDLRVMTLKRYSAPLTILKMYRAMCEKDTYLSFNKYHCISIVPGPSEPQHPISEAYRISREARAGKNVALGASEGRNSHVLQTLILFGDSSAFWEMPSDLLYITMIQFSDNRKVTLDDFQEQVRDACDKLQKKSKMSWSLSESDWCVYYTLDYSDAILFVRNCNYTQYQDLLWELTVKVTEKNKLVIDTISLYGVHAKKVKEWVKNIKKFGGEYSLQPLKNAEDSFDLIMFLGVQNAEAWNNVKKKLKESYGQNLRIYRKFGRTDVTVTFRRFNLEKALYLVWLLFSGDSGRSNNSFESCMIVPCGKLRNDTMHELKGNCRSDAVGKEKTTEGLNQIVERALAPLYQLANPLLYGLYPPLSGYCTELYQSLLALLHSSFAEEYYLSVLPSFAAHLKMFGDEIDKQKSVKQQDREDLVEELREYYRGLIMLEHSTLHGEKKFIQAPGLDAFICEVPAKLLVFYTAVAFRIIRRLQESDFPEDAALSEDSPFAPEEPLYVPLLIPDFRSDMYTRHVLDKQGRQMQIGIICLEEQLFYEPEYAIPSMVHEIAHRVGDKDRRRELRMEIIFRALSVYLICSALPDDLFEDMPTEAAKGIDLLAKVMAEQFVQRFRERSPDGDVVPYLGRVEEFLHNTGAGRAFLDKLDEREFVEELVEKWRESCKKSETDVLLPLLRLEDSLCGTMYYSVCSEDPRRPTVETTFFYALLERIVKPWSFQEEDNLYFFWNGLLSSFSETYSDLRMLETVDKLDYSDIMTTMFRRKDFGKGNVQEERFLRYELRMVPVCKALDREIPPQIQTTERRYPAKPVFVVQKAQDGMVEYLKACRQNKEPDKRISALVQSGGDIVMIREEIAHYRERLLQFFKLYNYSRNEETK